MQTIHQEITVTTDGACWPNNGKGNGGWAVVLRWTGGGDGLLKHGADQSIELKGHSYPTTNNAMELHAIRAGLESAIQVIETLTPGARPVIVIRSDSQYAINACTTWGDKWERTGWVLAMRGKRGQPVKNRQLIEAVRALTKGRIVKFTWVRGHAGDKDNERCDELAAVAMEQIREVLGWPATPMPVDAFAKGPGDSSRTETKPEN